MFQVFSFNAYWHSSSLTLDLSTEELLSKSLEKLFIYPIRLNKTGGSLIYPIKHTCTKITISKFQIDNVCGASSGKIFMTVVSEKFI